MHYNHKEIEAKWQKKWEEEKLYITGEDRSKPKYYILDMFPYPSGAGLHVGHPKGYIATDIFARYKMMNGFNVLHPMGWDAFGLPAENYAIKNKVHPRIATEENVKTFKKQLAKLGFTHDWEKEINTTDPEYYKWTQWAFAKMFEKGLAYESYEPINWCPKCMTGLSNEDLENGRCERCDSEIERKPMRQWVIKITDYADRLLADLDKLPHWEEAIKEMQRNWIGRSDGAEVKFKITSQNEKLENEFIDELTVFTTRPDTLFGCTYMVVAPEHPLIKNYESSIKNYGEIEDYIDKANKKSDLERTDLNKDKTGVKIEGISAINPVNNEEVPIYVADYVMMGYGTGAIMAVPAHDERDWEFATKYGIKIIEVVDGGDKEEKKCFAGDGININSDFLNGFETKDAKKKIIEWLEEKNIGKLAVNYKLKDWVFSRQRYWGEPIPLVYCEHCKSVIEEQLKMKGLDIDNVRQAGILNLKFKILNYSDGEILNPGWIASETLPVELPDVDSYEPTGTGESPLANITDWVNTTCPKCGGPAKRETNTMPQWAGSSWYYLRYIDPKNNNALVDKDKEKYWSPVDFYIGGAEHATRHLIYARFWHKFLYDIGVVNYEEPFERFQHVGLILAEDGRKMSKRWGNVINPDEIVEKFGADAMRVYEMFMGPFNQPCAWSTNGIFGTRKFLERILKIKSKVQISNFQSNSKSEFQNSKIDRSLHKTIKKVSDDIEEFKYNTAISQMMICLNEMEKETEISKDVYSQFIVLLAPFAPHLAEEIWSSFAEASEDKSYNYNESIFKATWPKYDPELAKDENINLVLQVNGKVRDTIQVPIDIDEEEAKKIALGSETIKKWVEGKEILKVIFVKGKLVNIVIN